MGRSVNERFTYMRNWNRLATSDTKFIKAQKSSAILKLVMLGGGVIVEPSCSQP